MLSTTATRPKELPMSATDTRTTNEERFDAYMRFQDLVRGGRVVPRWILGGPSFWYAEGSPQDRVIYRVDPVANTREPLFDPERLSGALAEALGEEPAGRGVPFSELSFVGPERLRFSLEGAS